MCLFCKIVNNEQPSYKIYEDEQAIAILDVFPISKGHVLIIPKMHVENAIVAPLPVMTHLMEVAQRIAPKLMDCLKADGCNLICNTNEAAGQSIFHLHMHLVPRYQDENPKSISYHVLENRDFIKDLFVQLQSEL